MLRNRSSALGTPEPISESGERFIRGKEHVHRGGPDAFNIGLPSHLQPKTPQQPGLDSDREVECVQGLWFEAQVAELHITPPHGYSEAL